jgi:hypothetical protein
MPDHDPPTWVVTAVATRDATQAFCPERIGPAIALLSRRGARLRAPESGGAADPGNAQHRRAQ